MTRRISARILHSGLTLSFVFTAAACSNDGPAGNDASGGNGGGSGGVSNGNGGTSADGSGGSGTGGSIDTGSGGSIDTGSGGSIDTGSGGSGAVDGGGSGAGGDGGTDDGWIPGAPIPPPVATGCVTDVTAGQHGFDCDGVHYEVTVPDRCLEQACGLVVDVHGATMSANMENNNSNLRALGSLHGYVVIQPSAPSSIWSPSTDYVKVFAFMQDAIPAFHLDDKRLHFMGFSQGGDMTWWFACQHSDLLASVAPAAAAGFPLTSTDQPCDLKRPAGTGREIPVLYMHGTQDGLAAFGQFAVPERDWMTSTYALGDEELVSSSAAHRRTRYTNADGGLFEFIEHDYVTDATFVLSIKGHCYPGSTDFTAKEPGQLMGFGCKTPMPMAFNWGEEAMKFFIAHPKP